MSSYLYDDRSMQGQLFSHKIRHFLYLPLPKIIVETRIKPDFFAEDLSLKTYGHTIHSTLKQLPEGKMYSRYKA